EGVAAKQSGDDAQIKGRSINEGEAGAERITTVLEGGIDVPTGSGSIPTAGPPATVISTGSEVGPTASPIVTSYSRRKGKEVMVESDTPKKQRLQEQIDAQEELQGMIDMLDRSNETIAKYLQEYQDFASELPLEKRIELISDLVKYQENYSKVYIFQSQQRRPMTKKQKREYYMAVIRSNLGWKAKDFKDPQRYNSVISLLFLTLLLFEVKKFMWDNIVCRFRLLGEIISDNGKQFWDNPFKDWCEKLCIRQHFASVKHSQTNGLVERANRSLGKGIKEKLDAGRKNWIEELSHVLWAHRTMIKSSNEDTMFSLTYGTKAVIPAEIGMPTLRTVKVDLIQNNEALEINLDLLEERREQAAIRKAKSNTKIEGYYNSKFQNTSFKPRNLVYRNSDASRVEDTRKLGLKWEGPYEVTEALGNGAYKLRGIDGKHLPRTWNIGNLKKCYIHKM
nr:reverse transcriptase domain-containing protein [Tanacetum cinerariifolium]